MGGGDQLRPHVGISETLGSVPFMPWLCPSAILERKTVAAVGTMALALTHFCPTSQEPVEVHLLQDKGVFKESAAPQEVCGPGKTDEPRGAAGESGGNPKPCPSAHT